VSAGGDGRWVLAVVAGGDAGRQLQEILHADPGDRFEGREAGGGRGMDRVEAEIRFGESERPWSGMGEASSSCFSSALNVTGWR